MKVHLVLICLTVFVHSMEAMVYSIRDYGAVGDGQTINTTAIQKTIDTCCRDGGGIVLIPAGTYMSGSLKLFSNVQLLLEHGAVLKGSANLQDYYLDGKLVGLLYCEDAENIVISGTGTIDGNGDVFFDLSKAKKIENAATWYTRQKERFREVPQGLGDGPVVPKPRPFQMIIFSNCKNVTVRDILITNSPFWTVHFADCDGVIVAGIRLWNNLLVPNGDGLDFTSCSNVLVSDCDIRAGDDAIAITGYDHHFDLPGYKYLRHDSENITVTNCTLLSRSSGIRIGGLDQNSMRNYTFSNIVIYNSNRGVGLFLRDAGSIEDMTFTNMVIKTRLFSGDWWGNGEPIHLSAIRLTEKVILGHLRNIKFSHILAEGESGMILYGTDERGIENVTFTDVSFKIRDNVRNETYGGNFDLRPVLEPRFQLFAHDIPAIYAQYIKNLSIDGFDLNWDPVTTPFFTHGIEIDQFEQVYINNFNGAPAPNNKNAAVIRLKNGQDFKILNSQENRPGVQLLSTENTTEKK